MIINYGVFIAVRFKATFGKSKPKWILPKYSNAKLNGAGRKIQRNPQKAFSLN